MRLMAVTTKFDAEYAIMLAKEVSMVSSLQKA
jgi:hypothetical protein